MLDRGSTQQTVTHPTASSVLTAHPAAKTAACVTVAKGICTVVTINKVAKKMLSESGTNSAESVIKANSKFESKIVESK